MKSSVHVQELSIKLVKNSPKLYPILPSKTFTVMIYVKCVWPPGERGLRLSVVVVCVVSTPHVDTTPGPIPQF